MASRFKRWQKRRRELAEGADADLMQANRQRFRVAFGLMGLALVLMLASNKIYMSAILEDAMQIASVISCVAGMVLMCWSSVEHSFLRKAEPEGPPEIFRDKPN